MDTAIRDPSGAALSRVRKRERRAHAPPPFSPFSSSPHLPARSSQQLQKRMASFVFMSTAVQNQMAARSLIRFAAAGASRARAALAVPSRAVSGNVSLALFAAAPRSFAAASARSMTSVSRVSAFRSLAAMATSDESASASSAASPEATLFVGNLPWSVDDASLRSVFSEFNPTNCKVVTDRESGRSKGIAFVNFGSEGDAVKAREALNGKARHRDTFAQPRSRRARPRPDRHLPLPRRLLRRLTAATFASSRAPPRISPPRGRRASPAPRALRCALPRIPCCLPTQPRRRHQRRTERAGC